MGIPWEKYGGASAPKPWEKYSGASATAPIQKPDDSVLDQIKAAPGQMAQATINQLPLIGSMVGGALGTPADVVTGPLGTLGGAALGGAGGASLKEMLNGYFFPEKTDKRDTLQMIQDMPDQAVDTITDPKKLWSAAQVPLKGAAEGLMNEAGGQIVGKGLGTAAEYAAPKLRAGAEAMSARAMGATKAIRKMLGREGTAEMGAHGLDNNIFGAFTGTGKMIENNKAVTDAAMKTRQEVYDAGKATLNTPELSTSIKQNLSGKFDPEGMLSTQAAQTNQMNSMTGEIERIGQKYQNGEISLNDAQKLIESLGKEAKFDVSRPSATNEIAQNIYGQAREGLNQAIEQGAGAEAGQAVRKANKTYSAGMDAANALENQAATKGNKLIGLTDTIAAAPALMGHGVNPASLAYGGAILGVKKIGENYGPQMAALGMNNASKALQSQLLQNILSNPQMLQPAADQMIPKYLQMNGDKNGN